MRARTGVFECGVADALLGSLHLVGLLAGFMLFRSHVPVLTRIPPRQRSDLHLPPHPTSCCSPVGCILAELLQRKPLFPGKDYIDQLKLIIGTLVRLEGQPAAGERSLDARGPSGCSSVCLLRAGSTQARGSALHSHQLQQKWFQQMPNT